MEHDQLEAGISGPVDKRNTDVIDTAIPASNDAGNETISTNIPTVKGKQRKSRMKSNDSDGSESESQHSSDSDYDSRKTPEADVEDEDEYGDSDSEGDEEEEELDEEEMLLDSKTVDHQRNNFVTDDTDDSDAYRPAPGASRRVKKKKASKPARRQRKIQEKLSSPTRMDGEDDEWQVSSRKKKVSSEHTTDSNLLAVAPSITSQPQLSNDIVSSAAVARASLALVPTPPAAIEATASITPNTSVQPQASLALEPEPPRRTKADLNMLMNADTDTFPSIHVPTFDAEAAAQAAQAAAALAAATNPTVTSIPPPLPRPMNGAPQPAQYPPLTSVPSVVSNMLTHDSSAMLSPPLMQNEWQPTRARRQRKQPKTYFEDDIKLSDSMSDKEESRSGSEDEGERMIIERILAWRDRPIVRTNVCNCLCVMLNMFVG